MNPALPALSEVSTEMTRQLQIHGQQGHEPLRYFAILTEEVLEAAREAQDATWLPDCRDREAALGKLRTELIQTAAVACSMVECLDRDRWRARRGRPATIDTSDGPGGVETDDGRVKGAVDRNQPEIVSGLRAIGASVKITSNVGHGFPDLVVGFRGRDYLLECKMPGGRLTPAQREWHRDWRGGARIVRGLADALEAIGAIQGPRKPETPGRYVRKAIG